MLNNLKMSNTEIMKLDADRICRVCLLEKSELFLIFDDTNAVDGTLLAHILTECTRYSVERYDELPHQMCSACIEAASAAYRFKCQTEQSYRKLLDVLEVPEKKAKSGYAQCGTQTEKLAIHPCAICGEKFFDARDLQEHVLTHRGAEKKCKVCGEQFTSMRQLRSHLAQVHPGTGLTVDIECSICRRQFSRSDHLRRHMRNIHGRLRPALETLDKDVKVNGCEFDETSSNTKTTHWMNCTDNEGILSISNNPALDVTNPISSEDEDGNKRCDMESEVDSSWLFNTKTETVMEIKVEPTDCFKPEFDIDNGSMLSNEDFMSNEKMLKMELKPEQEELHNSTNKTANTAGDWNGDGEKPDKDDYAGNNYDDEDNEEEEEDKYVLKLEKKKTSSHGRRTRVPIVREYLQQSSDQQRRQRRGDNKDTRCEQCQRNFSRRCHLLRHMLTHLNEKPHACTQCPKRFTRGDHLKKHIESVHEVKQFKCDQCAFAFTRSEGLQRHMLSRHGDGAQAHKTHECEYCSKKFASKNYLLKHKLLHTDRIYACKHCDQTFKERKLYHDHQRTHSEVERKFLCSVCGESFQRNDYLMVHMRRHTGEKPYKCRFCEKGFPRATDVKVHERYHTGDKPNICKLCGKGFHRAYNLTIHMRIHTGERPFKCDQCPKSFAQSNDLKAHIRRHTGERFKCRYCDAAFLQLYSLRQHALGVHGVQIDAITGRLQKFPPAATLTAEITQDNNCAAGEPIAPAVTEQLPQTIDAILTSQFMQQA